METGDDIELGSKHERVLLHQRNKLEEAKQVGRECEDMARDIKFNLRSQTDKLENKTLKNLYGMQRDMIKSNRLLNLIKKARMKNKLILYGIVAMLIICVIFIGYMALAPDSSSTIVEQEVAHAELPQMAGEDDSGAGITIIDLTSTTLDANGS